MKKYLACIVALALVMSLGACGKNNSNEKTGSNKSEKRTATQSAVSNDTSDKSDIGFSDESDKSEIGSYEIEYDESINEDKKLNTDLVNQIVDVAVKQVNAIVNDDYETFKNTLNVSILENEVSEDDIKNAFEDFKHEIEKKDCGNADFNQKITKVNVECNSEEFSMIIFIGDDNGVALGVEGIYSNMDFFVCFDDIANTASLNGQSLLKTANSNAKSVYNAVWEYLADMETQGHSNESVLSEIQGEIDCRNIDNYNETKREIIKKINSFGCSGIVFIDYSEDGVYTQWKESYDSEVIGQYPNPNSDINNNYGWGYYNY